MSLDPKDEMVRNMVGSPGYDMSTPYREMLSPLGSDGSVQKKGVGKKNDHSRLKRRTAKACNACRKLKTRCLPSKSAISCIRCYSLEMICSFEEEAVLSHGGNSNIIPKVGSESFQEDFSNIGTVLQGSKPSRSTIGSEYLTETRLKILQRDVNEVLYLLKKNGGSGPNLVSQSNDVGSDGGKNADPMELESGSKVSRDVRPLTDISKVKLFQYTNSVIDLDNLPSFATASSSYNTSPFKTFTELCSPVDSPIASLANYKKPTLVQSDLISLGVLTIDEAVELLQNFRDRYGRWVSFPDNMTTESLLSNIRGNCSLLLTACCSLSLRYGNMALKLRVYPIIMTRLKLEWEQCLAHIPNGLEFLQSLVILSFYGITLTTPDFPIDSWYISGIGLQQFLTMVASGKILEPENIPSYYTPEFYELTIHRIWNHLLLNHIVYCTFTGRMCIIDELRLSLSRKILELSNATNFDGRIVAEISSQLIVYNFIQFRNSQQSLPMVKDELREWFGQWSYLFDQPANQFVELGYHYGYLLILYNWDYSKHSPQDSCTDILLNADSISIRSMIFHCQKIVDAMLDTPNDSYFAFLSDQVHFCSNFGITMLMRILHVINLQQYNSGSDSLNRVEISKNELHKNLIKCQRLSNRYKKVSTGDGDVFMNYHLAIQGSITQLFPDFEE